MKCSEFAVDEQNEVIDYENLGEPLIKPMVKLSEANQDFSMADIVGSDLPVSFLWK